MGVHDDDLVNFEPTGPLPDIEARPGFAQRWVRTRKGNDADAHNLFAAARRGWAPRSPSSVPKALQWLTVQREGLGGCIGTHDMVLMERPNELNAREADVKRRDRRERERAVKNNLFSEYKGIGGARSGMTAPDVENSSRVERGRAPAIQDD
ncbi:MAG: hypothetical protein C4521_07500 [Actinobacteria bacterium]|nr:MAG: hypothetical protein C4521_07500 [Actinomycetota bacterium]